MAKLAIFLALATCGLLVETAKLVKRQSCETTDLPAACRPILTSTLDGAAFSDPITFLDTYCGSACAEPLYNYFRDCNVGSNNATKFNFYCSSTPAGNKCLIPLQSFLSSIGTACGDTDEGETCSSTCKAALASAYDSYGCCVISAFSVFGGYATASDSFCFCSDDPATSPPTLCNGGVTNSTLQFPPDFNPLCEAYVDDVQPSCRYLLRNNPETSFCILDEVCGDACGQEIYKFYRDCDERTGVDNATLLDVYCARNSDGDRCGSLFKDFSNIDLSACEEIEDFSCPAACRTGLQQALDDFGCCLPSLFQAFSGEDYSMDAGLVAAVCKVDMVQNCIGHFSEKPAPPPVEVAECGVLLLELPANCQQYASPDNLFVQAYSNPAQFKQTFCDGSCGKPVYEYLVKCDTMTGSNNASYVDFLCSENDGNRLCASIFSDTQLFDVLDNTCSETTDKFCSEECSRAIQEPSQTWSCCLFTLTALSDNVTYVADIVDECKLTLDPEVCIGGLSGQPVAAPGQPIPGPTGAMCESLRDAIPDECRDKSTFDLVAFSAFYDTDGFREGFCDTGCAKPVFTYINECLNKTEAAIIDFLCSKAPSGTDCVKLLDDDAFDAAKEGVCEDVSDKQCSRECQLVFEGFNKVYGCCLFTYTALDTNVTYARAVWERCGADNAELCTGGISNSAINAPGSEVEASALSNAVSCTVLMLLAIALAVLL